MVFQVPVTPRCAVSTAKSPCPAPVGRAEQCQLCHGHRGEGSAAFIKGTEGRAQARHRKPGVLGMAALCTLVRECPGARGWLCLGFDPGTKRSPVRLLSGTCSGCRLIPIAGRAGGSCLMMFLSSSPFLQVNKHTFKTERFQKGKCFQLVTRQPVSCQEGLCLHSLGTVLSAALHLFKAFLFQTPSVCDQNSQDLTGELSCPILEDAENSAFILM